MRFLELCQIIERREGKGRLSQKALAAVFAKAKIGEASQPNISRWLSGAQRPRYLETYEKLATFADVSPGWLAFGEQPPVLVQHREPPADSTVIDAGPTAAAQRKQLKHQRRRRHA